MTTVTYYCFARQNKQFANPVVVKKHAQMTEEFTHVELSHATKPVFAQMCFIVGLS